jgi:hypothetical protein
MAVMKKIVSDAAMKTRRGGEVMKLGIALALVLVATAAIAGPPIEDVYRSQSLFGTFLDGRFSESYAGGAQGAEGNVVHVMSWDGSALGTEWVISCPVLTGTPVLLDDDRDANGTGFVTYQTFYTGGTLWLSSTGPWGDEDYTGGIDYYSHVTTFFYFNNVFQTYTTEASVSGTFDGYCLCFDILANGQWHGTGALASGYPPYLDGDCLGGTVTVGDYGEADDITLSIYECASSTEPTDWGGIKALYR